MLKSYAELIMIFLTTLILSCNAFWWRQTSSEATPVIKQIPVGYFRTYTYHQPMTYPGSFYNTPHHGNNYQSNRFSGWSQFPSPSQNPPILSNYKYETQAPILTPPPPTPAPTSAPPPPTPAPTLPPPIQQPQYQQPSPPVSSSSSSNSIITTSIGHTFIETQPPAPQHISTGPIRASYPTPDFPKYQYYYSNLPTTNTVHQKPMQQIRFVPCMCPVTVSISSDYAENRSASLDDDDMDLPDNDNEDGGIGVKGKESVDDVMVK